MYHSLIILAIIFSLFPGKTSSEIISCSPMEISDALPVQFWLEGCATYNQHFADGVHHKCWCAPWQCDDVIPFQGKDAPGQNFSMLILDSDEQILQVIPIEEVSSGLYELNYTPSAGSPEICDEQIQLRVRKEAGTQAIVLPDLADWLTTSDSVDEPDWTLGAAPSVTLPGAGLFAASTSELLYVDFPFIDVVSYTISLFYNRVINSGSSNPRASTLRILDSSFVSLFSQVASGEPGANSITITFTATAATSRIAFEHTSGSDVTITVTSAEGTRELGDPEIIAKTDCLDIRETHEDTILLTFSNTRNFAGLVYENTSPALEFQIRIPTIFYHQRFPEEDEVMELSSSLVTLNGTVRKQRLMDIDYVPYYFHEKLKLILKHQMLEVYNRQWVKQEAYEILEGARTWPLKKAKVWLSEKDFVHRNIL